ncbi:MAG TPA: OB-fold nucleic acid binding domain-containing protein, partial [Bacteroidales bacterium]|nr:OB-fold nucleic acid binding domain-containing protein [Bacteroidales bacterium]
MVRVKELYKNAKDYEGKSVTLSGWIRTSRISKSFGFIELNDGGFFKNAQIVFDEDLSNFTEVSKYHIATAITVTGTVVYTPESKQPFEIKAQ